MMGARPCNACAMELTRLHCREDGTFLCPVCHAPTTVSCRADGATLCFAYDDDINSARHERLPVVPFFGPLADAPQPFLSLAFAAVAQREARQRGSERERERERGERS